MQSVWKQDCQRISSKGQEVAGEFSNKAEG